MAASHAFAVWQQEGGRNSIMHVVVGQIGRRFVELCGQGKGTSFMLCEYHAAALCNLAQQEAFFGFGGAMTSSSPSACPSQKFMFGAVK